MKTKLNKYINKVKTKRKQKENFMKKIIIPLIICAAIIPAFISNNSNNKQNQTETETTTKVSVTLYVLKDYKGRLALFINDNKIPKETYEIFTSSLPPQDAEKLKTGITVSTEAELQLLLEDYIS